MNKLTLFLYLSCFSTFLFAQIDGNLTASKHKADKDIHKNEDYLMDTKKHHQLINPLRENIETTPTSAVFGYLPYWEYPDALQYLQYDLLSHIAVFDFQVNSDGSIEYPSNWPWTDLINTAHDNGVKIILTAVNFNGSQINTILTNETVKENLFSNLANTLQVYSLDGINIDFEGVNYSDRGELLNSFMNELTLYLQNIDSSFEVSFAAPPVNWGGWDFGGLATACDYLFIMGYNFYGPWSNTSGACAPLIGGSYNITNVILEEYHTVVVSNPEKLILGVPYYGNKWNTHSNQSYSNTLDHISQPTYQIAMNRAELDTVIWDNISKTSWSYYENNNDIYQTWFDTDSSLGMKYDLADTYLLKGVGMWALGYDGYRLELWDELRKHYGYPVSIDDNHIVVNINIYPNPFSEKITLEVTDNDLKNPTIEIFDFQGKRIHPPIISYTQNTYSTIIDFDMNNFDSGMYFLNFTTYSDDKSTTISKKLIKKK